MIENGLSVRSAYATISIGNPGKRTIRVPKNTMIKAALDLGCNGTEPAEEPKIPEKFNLVTNGAFACG